MTNIAAFTINGTPSGVLSGDRGYDATAGEVLTFALEQNPTTDALSVRFDLPNSADSEAPLASLNDTQQLWDSNSLPQITLASANDSENCTINPATLISSYPVRCTVVTAAGTQVFERTVSIRGTSTVPALRMTAPAESRQYGIRGWSDALNELTLAVEGIGSTAGEFTTTNLVYVGKHGNDANTGRSYRQAKLTFGSAISVASGLTPSSSNPIGVWCEDSGRYEEDISVPSWVSLWAPRATIVGQASGGTSPALTVASSSSAKVGSIIGADTVGCVFKSNAAGEAFVSVENVTVGQNAGSYGVINAGGAGGVLHFEWRLMQVGASAFGIGDVGVTQGYTHVKGGDLVAVGANATLIGRLGSGSTFGHIDRMFESGSGIGSGVGIDVDTGEVDLSVDFVNMTTAFNVAIAAELNLMVTHVLAGTELGTGVKRVTTSGAFHGERSNEFSALANKAAPVGADLVAIEDSAASFVKKKATLTALIAAGSLVSSSASGSVNAFPTGVRRVLMSDGSTGGGVWEAPAVEEVPAVAAIFDFERLQGNRKCATVDPQASAATWVATSCAVTGTGPWTLTNNVGTVAARIADSAIVNVAANGLSIFEVDAAAGVADLMALVSNSAAIEEYFDLSTGILGTSSSTGVIVSRSITNLGGGVYRCRVLFRPDANLADLRIYIVNTDGSLTSALNDSIVIHRIKGDIQTYWSSVVNRADPGNSAVQSTASEAPSVIEWNSATPTSSVWDGENAGAVFYNGDTSLPASSLEVDGLCGRFNGVQRSLACYFVLKRIYNIVSSPQMLLSIREGSGNGYMTFFVEDTTLVISRRVAQASAYFATVTTVGTGSWVLAAGYYDNVNGQLRVASAGTAGSAVACSPASDVEGELAATEFNIGGESRLALGYTPSQSASQIAAAIIVGGPSDAPVTFGNAVDLRIRDWIQKRFSHRSLTV